MGPYYPFEGAPARFCLEYALEDIFRLKTRNTVQYCLAFDQAEGWKYSCLPSDNTNYNLLVRNTVKYLQSCALFHEAERLNWTWQHIVTVDISRISQEPTVIESFCEHNLGNLKSNIIIEILEPLSIFRNSVFT